MHIIVLLSLSSCGLGQTDVGLHSSSGGIWHGPSYGKHMSGTVYAVGLDYPEGYDWRTDAEKGTVRCFLVLFADGIPVLKVPVGDRHEVSSDIDRHRIRSGFLYTDYTDGMTTVIRRDGVEVVRFAGAEEIVDVEVLDGEIHTLGCPKDGGFAYRVNGEVMVERPSGTLLSGLSVCEGRMCFCFSQMTVSSDGAILNHYVSENGKVSMVKMDKDVEDVLDMGIYGDGLYVLARTGSSASPVLLKDGIRKSVAYFNILDIVSCRFMDTETMSVRLRYRHSGSDHMSDIVWTAGHGWKMFMRGGLISSLFNDEEGCHAVVFSSELHEGAVFSGNRRMDLDPGYHVSGDGCITVRDNIVYAGLTPDQGGSSVIWKNGEQDFLDMNGPLTCLR